MSYFQDIKTGIRTTLKGLQLTLRHLRSATKRRTSEGITSDNYFDLQNGLVTLQYPHEQLPIPDNGRYRLRNEIDDCIVCDKCAKVCPVDCITIDAIKATEEVGRASDGSPIRLYAATFDIDMAKCCYCGLCTVVCPTECLTMDKKFDYSEFELGKLTYNFSNLTEDQANEKRSLYEQFLREKEEAKAAQVAAKAAAASSESNIPANTAPKRPVFRPTAKPTTPPPAESANSEGSSIEHPLTDATPTEMERIAQGGLEVKKHPTFKPTQRPVKPPIDKPGEGEKTDNTPITEKTAVPKPVFRPSMRPGQATKPTEPEATPKAEVTPESTPSEPVAKPAGFRPTMKPPVKEPNTSNETEAPKPKPAFRPTMKPAAKAAEPKEDVPPTAEPEKSKSGGFRPTMKPASVSAKTDNSTPEPESKTPVTDPIPEDPERKEASLPKPKPAFRPTMKPASAPAEKDETAEPEPKAQAEPIIESPDKEEVEAPKPKPAFRPTMKPKPKPDDGQYS
ncbi:4Fe-4S dicluster domain-containing protein [Spirosoma harenae]